MATLQAPSLPNPVLNAIHLSQVDKSPLVDLSLKAKEVSVLKYQSIQAVGGSSVTLSASSTTQTIFNIPGSLAYNFARCYLAFDVLVTAAANHWNILFVDQVPIDSILLQTTDQTPLANLQNFAQYSKVVPFITTDLNDYLSRGPAWQRINGSVNYIDAENMCCQPCCAPIAQVLDQGSFTDTATNAGQILNVVQLSSTLGGVVAAAAADAPYGPLASNFVYLYNSGDTTSINVIPADRNGGTDREYVSPQHLLVSKKGAAMSIHFKVPFSICQGTILAYDASIMIGRNMQLYLNWLPISSWGVDTSSLTVTNSTCIAIVAMSISNLYLWMSKEMDINVVAMLRDKVNSGYDLLIPYTQCPKVNLGAVSSATLVSANTTLSSGFGRKLKRITSIPMLTTNTLTLTNMNFNVQGCLWTTVQSFLDNSPLQDQQLTTIQAYDYIRNSLKNSPLGLSMRTWEQQACFIDNFDDASLCGSKWNESDKVDSGFSIGQDSKVYNIQFTIQQTAGGISLYQYHTWLRKLSIMPNGLAWSE